LCRLPRSLFCGTSPRVAGIETRRPSPGILSSRGRLPARRLASPLLARYILFPAHGVRSPPYRCALSDRGAPLLCGGRGVCSPPWVCHRIVSWPCLHVARLRPGRAAPAGRGQARLRRVCPRVLDGGDMPRCPGRLASACGPCLAGGSVRTADTRHRPPSLRQAWSSGGVGRPLCLSDSQAVP